MSGDYCFYVVIDISSYVCYNVATLTLSFIYFCGLKTRVKLQGSKTFSVFRGAF